MAADAPTTADVAVHRIVAERLAEREQRYTASRRQIIDALAVADRPVTLPELLARTPGLVQSSAYRNLAVLEEVGAVRRLVHGSDFAHFELAEDLTEHHHHLICVQCGTIRDITLAPRLEQSLDAAFTGVAEAERFAATHHAIDIYGRCHDCVGA
jgi:Fe2+ or Zn2+ uptake regulation protein